MKLKVIDSIDGFGQFSIIKPCGKVKNTKGFTNEIVPTYKENVSKLLAGEYDINVNSKSDQSAVYIRTTVAEKDFTHGNVSYDPAQNAFKIENASGKIGESRIRSIGVNDTLAEDGGYTLEELGNSAGVRWIPTNQSNEYKAARVNRRYFGNTPQEGTDLINTANYAEWLLEENEDGTPDAIITPEADIIYNLDLKLNSTYGNTSLTTPMAVSPTQFTNLITGSDYIFDHYKDATSLSDQTRPTYGNEFWFPGWNITEIPNFSDNIPPKDSKKYLGAFSTIRCNFGGNSYILSTQMYDENGDVESDPTRAVSVWNGLEWYQLVGGATSFSHYWCFSHSETPLSNQTIHIKTPTNTGSTQVMYNYYLNNGAPTKDSNWSTRDRDTEQGKVILVELLNEKLNPIAGFAPTNAELDKNDNFYIEYNVKFELPDSLQMGDDINSLRGSTTTPADKNGSLGESMSKTAPSGDDNRKTGSTAWRANFIEKSARIFNPINSRQDAPVDTLYRSGLWRSSSDNHYQKNGLFTVAGNDFGTTTPIHTSTKKLEELQILGVSIHTIPTGDIVGTDADIQQSTDLQTMASAKNLKVIQPLKDDNDAYVSVGTNVPYTGTLEGEISTTTNHQWEFFWNPNLAGTGDNDVANGNENKFGPSIRQLSSLDECLVDENNNVKLKLVTGNHFIEQPRWYRIWFGGIDSIFNYNELGGSDIVPTLFLVNVENVLIEGRIESVESASSSWTQGDTITLNWTIQAP
tara:strand:- start:310 stop:2550 length:2241 start_codon:yes stop_codon:yes gene_type:complete